MIPDNASAVRYPLVLPERLRAVLLPLLGPVTRGMLEQSTSTSFSGAAFPTLRLAGDR